MSWRDNLVEASYRDVVFHVKGDMQTKIGRRGKLVEYYKKEVPWNYDFGVKAREYNITGYVIQSPGNDFDYFQQRNRLIAAFEKAPIGRESSSHGWLNHPTIGLVDVTLKEPVEFTENITEDGGMATFTAKFIQYGVREEPSGGTDPVTDVDNKAVNAKNKNADNYGTRYTAGGAFSESLLDGAKRIMTTIQGTISKLRGAVSSVVNESINIASQAISTVDTLLDTPCLLNDQYNNVVEAISNVCGLGEDTIEDFVNGECSGAEISSTILDGSSIPSDLTVSATEQMVNAITTILNTDYDTTAEQELNIRATVDSNISLLLIEAMRISIRGVYANQTILFNTLNSLMSILETFFNRIGSYNGAGELFESLTDLRDVFIEGMISKASDVAKLIDYTVSPDVETTLVLAYNQYEDITRDEEIFLQNQPVVDHPGFLPGNSTIRILDE